MQTLVLIAGAYLVGSINWAILLCRLGGLRDPRQHGSQNPGATNVYRIGGRFMAVATLTGDVAKGLLPVLLAIGSGANQLVVALVFCAAVLGHCYPVFFAFVGGKGVATALGGMLALSLPLALCLAAIWIMVFAKWRYSSAASITSAVAAPVLTLFLIPQHMLSVVLISALLCWRHQENWQRLKQKSEHRISKQTNR